MTEELRPALSDTLVDIGRMIEEALGNPGYGFVLAIAAFHTAGRPAPEGPTVAYVSTIERPELVRLLDNLAETIRRADVEEISK